MMARFYGYLDKVFQFRRLTAWLTDSRPEPLIPTAAVFGTAFAMFATCRGSLNGIDKERHFPGRLQNFVGPHVPSGDTVGRVYAQLDSGVLREVLRDVHLRIKRNKMLATPAAGCSPPWTATSFFASRKRCCDQCLTRTLKVDDQEVTEYYHRGVVCHLIGQDLAIPLDLELQRPGEGEVPAAKRLLERVFANYPRYFDAVVGDGLYFEAPFINFCREHHKDVVVVVKGDHRLLLQDAEGLFSQRGPDGQWTEGRRTVQYWDDEGFTSCEGVAEPLRVLHTLETEQRRERIAGQWKQTRGDFFLVLGHDLQPKAIVRPRILAGRPLALGHRERLLQHHRRPTGAWITFSSTNRRRSSISCSRCFWRSFSCNASGGGTSSRRCVIVSR